MNENEGPRKRQLSVNVISVTQAGKHLRTILTRFRDAHGEPLIFGDENTPEAAIIPFADYMRLLALEQDAEHAEEAFQAEVQHRLSSGERLTLDSVEDFARSLGQAGSRWADEHAGKADDE